MDFLNTLKLELDHSLKQYHKEREVLNAPSIRRNTMFIMVKGKNGNSYSLNIDSIKYVKSDDYDGCDIFFNDNFCIKVADRFEDISKKLEEDALRDYITNSYKDLWKIEQ
jgi:hypothetical protein